MMQWRISIFEVFHILEEPFPCDEAHYYAYLSPNFISKIERIIKSMIELRPRKGTLRLVFRLFSLMRGLPSIRLK